MFDLFRRMCVWWISLVMAYYAVILAVGAVAAIANFTWLAAQGRFAEAATMYLSVAGFGVLVAFCVWIHCDATASSRRLEKYLRKTPEEEEEDEDDEATAPPSELIRPGPGPSR